MHSYIVTGGSGESRLNKIKDLTAELGVNRFDIIKLGSEDLSSIGIADVREFQKMLSLAPAYGKVRLGIINFAETLTTEAQQALLKTLEEPPPHAKIILETQILDVLLPTIISRCQIISLTTGEKLDEEVLKACLKTLEQIQQAPIGKRLQVIESIGKTREEVVAWITLAILSTRKAMLAKFGISTMKQFNNLTIPFPELLRRLIKAQSELSANVNPKLVLDNVFL